MGHIWVLYGQKSLYGAHVGLEWDKCPDSSHMGPTYTCLLGIMSFYRTDLTINAEILVHVHCDSTSICICFNKIGLFTKLNASINRPVNNGDTYNNVLK